MFERPHHQRIEQALRALELHTVRASGRGIPNQI